MSWWNPSQQEAQEAYDAAKRKYDTAAEDYVRLSKLKEQYASDASSNYRSYVADHDRLSALQKLDFKLQRMARFLGPGESGLDMSINISRISALTVGEAINECLVTDVGKFPTLVKETTTPLVDYDEDSARAKQLVNEEIARVQEEISAIKGRTQNSVEAYNEMSRMVKSCEDEMASLKKTMDSCAFDMDHYKKYL